MKKIIKIFLLPLFFLTMFASFKMVLANPTPVYAEETEVIETNPEKEINHITFIDVTLLPSTITAGTDSTALVKITYEHEYSDEYKNEKLTWYIDGSSSSGKAYASIISYDTNGNALVSVTGTSNGPCTIIFLGVYSERTAASTIKGTYSVTIEPYETVVSVIKGILTSSTVLILILTVAVTVIGRSAIKIFRFGVNYKSNFATVEQQANFEKAIREEMRSTKTEIQDSILKICLREIQRETRPLRDLQTMASSIERDREILNVRLDSIDQKYNEVRKVAENINQLEQKVSRLQYGEGSSDIRRSGK